MAKKYFITNDNDNDNDNDDVIVNNSNYLSHIFFTIFIWLCIAAIIFIICNYFLNYNINISTILIISIIIILCKYILD